MSNDTAAHPPYDYRLKRLATFSDLLYGELKLDSQDDTFKYVRMDELDQAITKIKGVQEKLEQCIKIIHNLECRIAHERFVTRYGNDGWGVDFRDEAIPKRQERVEFTPPFIERAMQRSLTRLLDPERVRLGPVNRIVPTPVDEVDSGYINEELPADHPFFKSVPLTYVHGGPAASCMYCKETLPCGCKTPPPTPPPMSPPPVRMKAKRRSDSPITAADIYFGLRDAQEIPEESYSLSDSQKALLEDSVMQK